jgi:hypothetical protein
LLLKCATFPLQDSIIGKGASHLLRLSLDGDGCAAKRDSSACCGNTFANHFLETAEIVGLPCSISHMFHGYMSLGDTGFLYAYCG